MDYAFEFRAYKPGEVMEARPLPPIEDMKRFAEDEAVEPLEAL